MKLREISSRAFPVPGDPRSSMRLVEEMVPYVFCAGRLAGKRVLEIGCGSGVGARHLATRAREVHAYDRNPQAVAWARAHYPAANLFFRVLGAEPQPERCGYDAVCAFRALDRPWRARRNLRWLADRLDAGGELLVGARNRPGPQADPLREAGGLTPDALAALLDPLFLQVRILGIRGNAKVRAYREHRRRALGTMPRLHPLRLGRAAPGPLRRRLGNAAETRLRRGALAAGGPSPLAIDPEDFQVSEEGLAGADRLLAVCAEPARQDS